MKHGAIAILSLALLSVGCSTDARAPSLATLDGCYRGVGLPSFMRPADAWAFRIRDGKLSDRQGKLISSVRVIDARTLGFNPGIATETTVDKVQIVTTGGVLTAPIDYEFTTLNIVVGSDPQFDTVERFDCP